VSKFKMVPVHCLTFSSAVLNKFVLSNVDVIAVADRLSIASVEYKPGHIIVTDENFETGGMQFGRVINFVSCSDSSVWYMVIETLQTIEFCAQYHAYCLLVKEPKVYSLITIAQLVDHHPMYCLSKFVNGKHLNFVRMPYRIFKI